MSLLRHPYAAVGGGMLGMKAAATVSLGASGAVFGLFAISVLLKLRLDLKSILVGAGRCKLSTLA